MSNDVVRWTSYILITNEKNSRKMVMLNLFKIFVLLSLVIIVNNNNRLVLGDELNIDSDNNYINLDGHYSHTWAVHVDGDKDIADQIASDHGFINLGPIIKNYYHFKHNHIIKRSLNPSERHQIRLENDSRVKWAKQQKIKSRTKRDLIRARQIKSIYQLNDPKWSQMWYLNRGNNIDMNVLPAWREGVTGKGVVVTILDDGLETDHPDLEQNYDPKASYDVNSHDEDPMPHYDLTDSNRHGTRCAGEVAATANNSLCAVGIAFGANVGGVRMLDGDVTDAVEARSLSLNPQHIDIYSASWGPDDDGKTVDGPGELATHAFIEGVTKGRNGKGSIFIWASGNGGREHDNCNCDGYTNSIWTLSISSATEEGLVPWYSEMCSSTLATTYSSGNQGEKQIVTTDLHHSCTSSHTGTSASAPLAAGIVALVLEANQNLTWRDLQHIVVRTAKPGNLRDPNWSRNGVGRRVSHSFGYGLMDAAAMVRLARNWNTVPEQQRCEINAPHLDRTIPPKSQITLQLTVQHCRGVNYLEHVQAKISLTSQRRGDIQIYLTSPAATRVTLLTSRSHDVSRSGFIQWPFMSVHTWGEAPHGNWQLEIQNEGRYMAQITQWDLLFYGTNQPFQPDDSLRNDDKPGFNYAYGSGIEHNSLEFRSETASGQWRETHQVGESLDIQRSTINESSGSTCLHSSPDNKCLECVQSAYLYEGNCYDKCPNRTYLSAYLSVNNEENANDNWLQLSLREHDTNGKSLEVFLQQKLCYACHATCTNCTGPFDYDCTACDDRSYLKIINYREKYCRLLLPTEPTLNTICNSSNHIAEGVRCGNEISSNNNNFILLSNNQYLYVFLLFISIVMIIIFFCFIYIFKKIFFNQTSKYSIDSYSYTYNPLKTVETKKITEEVLSSDSELDEIIHSKNEPSNFD